MLEQTIRLVNFENTTDGIILRFGPLGNTSHQKKILKDLDAKVKEPYIKAGSPDIEIPKDELRKTFYDQIFLTLEAMNEQFWRLESFATIYDDSMLKMQVAIFSREIPAE